MNIHEQLQAVKSDLEERDARAKTLRVIDKMIAMAEPQRDSGLSVSRLQSSSACHAYARRPE